MPGQEPRQLCPRGLRCWPVPVRSRNVQTAHRMVTNSALNVRSRERLRFQASSLILLQDLLLVFLSINISAHVSLGWSRLFR